MMTPRKQLRTAGLIALALTLAACLRKSASEFLVHTTISKGRCRMWSSKNRLQVSSWVAVACVALSGPAFAGQTVAWNKMAFDVAVPSGVSTGARLARTLAVMHLAMHDAVNNVEERYARYAVTSSSPSASADAAANAAAYGVL